MSSNPFPPIAVQLYSLRHLSEDFEQLIHTVAEIGYRAVELVGVRDRSAEDVAGILQSHGVQAVSAHVPYHLMAEQFEETVAFQKAVGNTCIIVPAPPSFLRESTDAADWRDFGAELDKIGARCAQEGVRFGYHNHWWEMTEVEGKRLIDWLLESAAPEHLFWEPDLAWVTRGGADPLALLAQYAGRCPRVHAKDLAAAGENEDQMGLADVGHGVLDWDALLPACKAAGAEWYVVEHDLPKEPVASVQRSLAFLQSKADLL